MSKVNTGILFPYKRSQTSRECLAKWRYIWTYAVLLITICFLLPPARVHRRTDDAGMALAKNIVCDQPKPPSRSSNFSRFVESPNFAHAAASRLAGAVRIPTMTFDDMDSIEEDDRWAPFAEFHDYLKVTFPLTHAGTELNVTGGYSLVYTWPGSNENLKPLMLTGHLDVVPALTALDRWTYPPFSGAVDGEWVYGRGSADCKNNVIAIMTAVENLISVGWKPRRTIILAFGQDEEISGPRGATNIALHLEEKYGKNGIAMIVDEGGMGLDTLYGKEFALPAVGEKGYINVEIGVDMQGGHSSVPPAHTSIGILAKVISAIEDSDIFKPRLEISSPIWGYLSCVARHGNASQVPSWISEAISAKDPDLGEIAKKFASVSDGNRYLIQTSKAVTIVHAGLKSNALAEAARAVFNSRIDFHSSCAEVRSIYHTLVKPIAEKYSLRLEGQMDSHESPIGNISLKWPLLETDPSPISPFDSASDAWNILSRAIQASFGENVITAPTAMTGNTDTRYYWNLSTNIYRWSPTRTGTRLNVHTIDEKIKIKTHVEGIKFFAELIIQADAVVTRN